jgi:hypothetical protein
MPLPPKCLITTSWDDGFPLDLRLADLLAKHGLPATFYIPTSPDTPVVTRAQIRELATTFEVAAHTIRHIPLTRLPLAEAGEELIRSREEIEDITGKACPIVCFPQGKYARAHLRMAREAGFLACRTVGALSVSRPMRNEGILVMSTSAQVHTHSPISLARNIVKRRAGSPAWNWMCCRFQVDWIHLAAALLDRAVKCGGVFHLWGHSWEIEQHGEWKRLDHFLRHLAGYRLQAMLVNNSEVCLADAEVAG